ncbi:MAG: type 4a pilus biogenesis protein PilO [Candidatus Jacksonbacteria bacterium]|jgi:Tfp pilus assembly protein PilO|nr:type 4a pilus biogenesis protein PilO [Candidatus Jacksonbacteria bacterium]MBT6034651.1 type 4a pilus biogenesis protein PilO [Candidatus Jacksonbacteria bacterium]MBT6301461.1 type 4a pilus biogenesis protein PilO [Candidatus Jacksonbacteria bacterium]MBT6757334.1 type 4a pilus biogenesis protein PilO [Candidatus Jacksonbacteria bacterium]MBT6955462.1 type 4a pilus biogenesis protein PilO [Candidatus Jacksonbacteria bacterium]
MTSNRKRLAVQITIICLLVGFFAFAILLPVIKDINAMNGAITEQRTELEKLYEKGQFFRIVRCQLANVEKDYNAIQSLFINPDKQLEFITHLESLALQNNLSLQLSLGALENTLATASENSLVPIQASLSLAGDYTDIQVFIKELETAQFLISLSDVSIRSIPQNSTSAPFQAQLQATSYWTTYSQDYETTAPCTT